MWTLPWAEKTYPREMARLRQRFPSDFRGVPVLFATLPKTVGDPYTKGEYVDEWGCRFTNIRDGGIGEVKNPLVPASEKAAISVPVMCHRFRKWQPFARGNAVCSAPGAGTMPGAGN